MKACGSPHKVSCATGLQNTSGTADKQLILDLSPESTNIFQKAISP